MANSAPTEPSIQSVRFHSALLGLVAATALVFAQRAVLFGPPVFEYGDLAANALQIENAKHFQELYGNYSRFQFNHPGPAFFYVYALGEWLWHDLVRLVASPHQAHLLMGVVLQCTFLATSLAILQTRWRHPLVGPLGAMVTASYFALTGTVFTSIWPPYVLALPFLCFLTALASVSAGETRHLPIAAICGGFLVHGHVAQPLFVVGLGGVALLLLRFSPYRCRSSEPRPSCRPWLVTGSVVAAFLLPLVVDLWLHGLTGNTATIVRRFLTNTADSKPAVKSALYFLSFATPMQNQDSVFAAPLRQSVRALLAHGHWLATWLVGYGLVAGFLLRRWPRLDLVKRRFVFCATVLWAATVVLAIVWGMAQAGPMWRFNGAFFVSIYLFPLLLAGAVAAGAIRHVRLISGLSGAIAIAALLWGFRSSAMSVDERGERLAQVVERALSADATPARPKVLQFDHGRWPVAAAMALQLERRGVPWFVMNQWTFMFGERRDLRHLGSTPLAVAEIWHVDSEMSNEQPVIATARLDTTLPIVDPANTIIDSATNFDEFALTGFDVAEPERAWSILPNAALVFTPLPAESDVVVSIDAAANDRVPGGITRQRALLRLNGEIVGEVAVTTRTTCIVTIPRARWNSAGSPAMLEFEFLDAVPDNSFSRPRSRDAYAWGVWQVSFQSAR